MRSCSLLAVAALIAVAAAPSEAMVIRSGNQVVVEEGEVIDDDLLANGAQVEIRGTVNGDVIAFAQSVIVSGSVGGTLNTAAQTVTISGSVEGTVRAAAQVLNCEAPIGGNLLAAGQTVDVAEDCVVGRDAYLAGDHCRMAGAARDLRAAANNLVIEDGISRDVVVYVDTMEVGPDAKIGGDLTYTSPREVQIRPGAVAGKVSHQLPRRPHRHRPGPWGPLFLLVTSFVTGLVIALGLPRQSRSIAEAPLRRPGATLGWGAVAFAATPVIASIVMITIIGLPLGAITLVLWAIALYLGYVFAAMTIGRGLLRWALKGRAVSLLWCLLLGLVVLALVRMIPYAGPLLALVAILWAMGGIIVGIARQEVAERVSSQ
jgi:hypothetical protein